MSELPAVKATPDTPPGFGQRIPAPILASTAILVVQIGSSVAKDLAGPHGALTLACLRNAIGAAGLFLIARPTLTGLDRRQWGVAFVFGIVFAVMNGCFYLAIARLPLGTVVTIEFLGPLTVAVFGARRGLDYLWPVIAAAGVLMLAPSIGAGAPGSGTLDPLGFALALGSATFWGIYIIVAGRAGRLLPGFTGLVLALGFAALLTAPFISAVELARMTSTPLMLGGVLVVGLFSTMLPYALEFAALKRLPAAVFGVLMSTEPGAAAVFAFIILGEVMRPLEWVALVLVTAAALGAALTRRPAG